MARTRKTDATETTQQNGPKNMSDLNALVVTDDTLDSNTRGSSHNPMHQYVQGSYENDLETTRALSVTLNGPDAKAAVSGIRRAANDIGCGTSVQIRQALDDGTYGPLLKVGDIFEDLNYKVTFKAKKRRAFAPRKSTEL